MGTKYLNTPCGPFKIPSWAAEHLDSLSDIELMDEYVQKCKQFVDPFLFQEMVNRRLIFKGDTYRDVEEQLYRLQTGK